MIWFGRDLIDLLVPNPSATGRSTFHYTRLLKAPSNLDLNTFREGASATSPGNQYQEVTTLRDKNFLSLI